MIKLISMTDFVLKQEKQNQNNPTQLTCLYANYANFIRQPLTLGMFTPCDEEGNILEEPIDEIAGVEKYSERYQQAKERVLFEGFELVNQNYHIFVQSEKLDIRFSKKDKSIDSYRFRYIEDLTCKNLTLSQSVLKQIGL